MPLAVLLLTAALADAPYSLAASENFSVYAPSQPAADAVLVYAESLRRELAREWLGQPLPAGAGRTLIHIRLTPEADRGRSSVVDHRSHSGSNLLWIETDAVGTDEFNSTLQHELTHCILATRYPGDVPVWAHEGCAGQYDVGARRRLHEQTVDRFSEANHWPAVSELLAAEQFDPNDRVSYGAAVSLAEYLIRLQGREHLVRFAVSGRQEGDWNRALQQSYGVRDVTELQRNWQQWASTSTGSTPSQAPLGNALSRSSAAPATSGLDAHYLPASPTSAKNAPSRSISP